MGDSDRTRTTPPREQLRIRRRSRSGTTTAVRYRPNSLLLGKFCFSRVVILCQVDIEVEQIDLLRQLESAKLSQEDIETLRSILHKKKQAVGVCDCRVWTKQKRPTDLYNAHSTPTGRGGATSYTIPHNRHQMFDPARFRSAGELSRAVHSLCSPPAMLYPPPLPTAPSMLPSVSCSPLALL